MKLLLLSLLLSVATSAQALDVCPVYNPVHDREVMLKIKSGIPFKLLSVASDGKTTYRRIVHLIYDLWSETLTIEVIGSRKESNIAQDFSGKICQALSFKEAHPDRSYHYQLLLNPVLGEGLRWLQNNNEHGSGFLQINSGRLAKDLETEKILIDQENLK